MDSTDTRVAVCSDSFDTHTHTHTHLKFAILYLVLQGEKFSSQELTEFKSTWLYDNQLLIDRGDGNVAYVSYLVYVTYLV